MPLDACTHTYASACIKIRRYVCMCLTLALCACNNRFASRLPIFQVQVQYKSRRVSQFAAPVCMYMYTNVCVCFCCWPAGLFVCIFAKGQARDEMLSKCSLISCLSSANLRFANDLFHISFVASGVCVINR